MTTEQDWLSDLKNRDAAVQQQFWAAQWPVVYAISRYILGNSADASEVAVDVLSDFMTTYLHNVTTSDSVQAYIRLMATRRALKYRTKRNRMVAVEFDSFSDLDNLDPEQVAQLSQLIPRISVCMEKLTPKAQSVVRLRYRKHMTKTAIAETVGASKQYIGRLLKRSLELLKLCLDPEIAGDRERVSR